jgi:hypothetical protein
VSEFVIWQGLAQAPGGTREGYSKYTAEYGLAAKAEWPACPLCVRAIESWSVDMVQVLYIAGNIDRSWMRCIARRRKKGGRSLSAIIFSDFQKRSRQEQSVCLLSVAALVYISFNFPFDSSSLFFQIVHLFFLTTISSTHHIIIIPSTPALTITNTTTYCNNLETRQTQHATLSFSSHTHLTHRVFFFFFSLTTHCNGTTGRQGASEAGGRLMSEGAIGRGSDHAWRAS